MRSEPALCGDSLLLWGEKRGVLWGRLSASASEETVPGGAKAGGRERMLKCSYSCSYGPSRSSPCPSFYHPGGETVPLFADQEAEAEKRDGEEVASA